VLALPSRKELAGPLLKTAAKEAIDDGLKLIRRNVLNGSFLSLALDGFETTGRQHITGVVLSDGKQSIPFDAVACEDVHHAIAVAKTIEDLIEDVQERLSISISSICTDDAG
jgi:hypothetical protein